MSTHLAEHAGAPADHDDFGGLHRDLAATRETVAGLAAKRFSRRHMVRALGVVVPAAVAILTIAYIHVGDPNCVPQKRHDDTQLS